MIYLQPLYLGEHHNSLRDHLLQADILKALRRSEPKRRMAVGLEAIQRRFQPVLDEYLKGTIDLKQLEDQTEWSTRWTWPFANYVPVFEAAKQNNFELLALNADSEDLGVVEMSGLAGLPNTTLAKYIPDRRVFADFTNTTAFREYIAYVVAPSYRSHKEMGILRQTISGQRLNEDMPFKNFYSGRMLWDNSMANTGAAWTKRNPSGLLVSIVGADHVKFGGGVPNRYAYAAGLELDKVRTVILNPSAVDTAGPQLETLKADAPVPLTLQIRFAAADGDGGIPNCGKGTSIGAEASYYYSRGVDDPDGCNKAGLVLLALAHAAAEQQLQGARGVLAQARARPGGRGDVARRRRSFHARLVDDRADAVEEGREARGEVARALVHGAVLFFRRQLHRWASAAASPVLMGLPRSRY